MTNLTTLLIADGKYILSTYENPKGEPCANLKTKRGRTVWQYKFNTPEKRDQYAVSNCEQLEKSEEKRAEQSIVLKQKQNENVASLKVGDVFYTSWGYDQTNTDFFKIVKISGKRITVRQLVANRVETGFMSGDCTASGIFCKDAKDIVLGVSKYGSFRIEGHYAEVWNGKPKYYSYYA
jgi:hypothetical protein